jgi:hypothetical protein
MKSVAVTLAASLSLLIGGCAGEKSVHSAAVPVVSEESGGAQQASEDVSSDPAVLAAADGPAEGEATALGSAQSGENTDTVSTASDNGDASVRDAKEAAEDAARRIFDATVDAATRIKEVGIGAVQAVRETTTRKNGDPAEVTEAEGPEIVANGSDKANPAED